MINLLPPQQKQKLSEEDRLRLILILGILFLSFLASLSLVLLLVKNYTSGDLKEQNIFLAEKERLIFLNHELEKEINDSNVLLSILNSSYQEKLDLTQVLEKIYQTLPLKTYLINFNFSFLQKEGKGKAQISLAGFSPDRETLLVLKKNLENEKDFSEVYFSPESWVKPTDIIFSVAFKLNK